MEQEQVAWPMVLYYLVYKFLESGPCQQAAKALEQELGQHRQLLPHSMAPDGSQEPLSVDRIAKKYPETRGPYLLSLLESFIDHYKTTADPSTVRGNALRHGDDSLLTMLSAFTSSSTATKANCLEMTTRELAALTLDRLMDAREMGVSLPWPIQTQGQFSTYYKERVTLRGHRHPVFCLAFDKTNRRLFTGSDDYLVKVWCVRTGFLIYTIRGHYNVITDIAINEENTLIATASSDGYIRVWTMDGYRQVVCLRPATTTKPFTTVRFSPSPRSETRFLMATNEDGLVRLWRWNRDTLGFPTPQSPIAYSCKFKGRDKLRCSSFNSCGSYFTVAGDDGFVYVFSTVQHLAKRTSATLSARHENKEMQRRRRRAPNALFPDKSGNDEPLPIAPVAILEGHRGRITDLAYSNNGEHILSGSQDGTARLWTYNAEEGTYTSVLLDITQEANVPVVEPEDVHASNTSSDDKASPILEDEDEFGTLVPPMPPLPMPATAEPMSVDPVQPEAASQQQPGQEEAAAVPTDATPAAQAATDEPRVSMIAWTINDMYCLVATTHGALFVYYACNGQLAFILKGHVGEVYAVDNHPLQADTILSAGYDGNVILWDLAQQSVIACQKHEGRIMLDCKFSDDGMKYAITDDEGTCTLFSINGLEKDYARARSWTRGQYFYNDYSAVRYFPDGTFVDDQTNTPTHQLAPSPIIDMQGIEYAHQPRRGYGRNITIQSPTFENEDAQRALLFEQHLEAARARPAVPLPSLDRAYVAKLRREFVHPEDDEAEQEGEGQQLPMYAFPPPVQPALLLPDDSDDEDYQEQAIAQDDDDDSESPVGDEELEADSDASMADVWDDDNDDNVRVTRRRGRSSDTRRLRTRASSPSQDTTSTRGRRRRRAGMSTRSTEVIGSPMPNRTTSAANARATSSRSLRRRAAMVLDDDDDAPVRPRRRRQPLSYQESDADDYSALEETSSEEEQKEQEDEDEEDEDVQIDDDNDQSGQYRASAHIASSSRATSATRRVTRSQDNTIPHENGHPSSPSPPPSAPSHPRVHHGHDDDDDDDNVPIARRKGKGRARGPRISDDDDESDDFVPDQPPQAHRGPITRRASAGAPPATAAASSTSTTRGHKKDKKDKKEKKDKNKQKAKLPVHERDLNEDELKLYEPSEWITSKYSTVEKYHPQLGDRVVLLVEGFRQYWAASDLISYFDEKHGPADLEAALSSAGRHHKEPVVFALITGVTWHVGPPTFCSLKLKLQDITNLRAILTDQTASPHWVNLNGAQKSEITIDYCDEDGSPEFIVLWHRFHASMRIFFGPNDLHSRVDAMYDVGKYSGRVSTINQNTMEWPRAKSRSPWACYHIIWDDDKSPPEDLSPWEVVPENEDFNEWYAVPSSLTQAQIKRANDIIDYLVAVDDFLLYVHPVDYRMYSDYLTKVAYPICLEMVRERLNNGFYRQVDALIDDVNLIRKDAQRYNHAASAAAKNAVRMANFFKSRMQNPHMVMTVGRAIGKRKSEEQASDDEFSAADESEEDDMPSAHHVRQDMDDDDDDAFIDDDDYDDE
ncbi:hypothetical protein BC940DRAFT_372111 [Gongronella butleri]|nr:hypothetical protein BC940DRAFT_372111 [Gongronella butleri]